MVYQDGDSSKAGVSFIDLNRGTWLSPTWCNTETGEFRGWIWRRGLIEFEWIEIAGVFPFDVVRKGIVIDKARP